MIGGVNIYRCGSCSHVGKRHHLFWKPVLWKSLNWPVLGVLLSDWMQLPARFNEVTLCPGWLLQSKGLLKHKANMHTGPKDREKITDWHNWWAEIKPMLVLSFLCLIAFYCMLQEFKKELVSHVLVWQLEKWRKVEVVGALMWVVPLSYLGLLYFFKSCNW